MPATADRRPPSWNQITDSTHAPPVGNVNPIGSQQRKFRIFSLTKIWCSHSIIIIIFVEHKKTW